MTNLERARKTHEEVKARAKKYQTSAVPMSRREMAQVFGALISHLEDLESRLDNWASGDTLLSPAECTK